MEQNSFEKYEYQEPNLLFGTYRTDGYHNNFGYDDFYGLIRLSQEITKDEVFDYKKKHGDTDEEDKKRKSTTRYRTVSGKKEVKLI